MIFSVSADGNVELVHGRTSDNAPEDGVIDDQEHQVCLGNIALLTKVRMMDQYGLTISDSLILSFYR